MQAVGFLLRSTQQTGHAIRHTPYAVRTTHYAGRLPVYPFPIIMPVDQIYDELSYLDGVEVGMK
jgi:hypothetical protein